MLAASKKACGRRKVKGKPPWSDPIRAVLREKVDGSQEAQDSSSPRS